MARGSNPNSRANLTKGKGFCTETARKAQIKSVEAHKQNTRLQKIAYEALTDDVIIKIVKAIIKRAENGDIAAFKAICEVMGETNHNQTSSQDIRLAIVPLLPPDESDN